MVGIVIYITKNKRCNKLTISVHMFGLLTFEKLVKKIIWKVCTSVKYVNLKSCYIYYQE